MKNKILVYTIRFQVYVFLIVSDAAGVSGLFLRDDALTNPKIVLLTTFGIIIFLLFVVVAINNYSKTNRLIKKEKK